MNLFPKPFSLRLAPSSAVNKRLSGWYFHILLLLTIWPIRLDATVYYVDWVAGADGNNGTAKATPWKRAPGMKAFAGSYTHGAGDRFIFKGGTTWPVSCFQMLITVGGSPVIADFYGTDPTWYSGGSYSPPIFDFQHTMVGAGWTLAAGILIQNTAYIEFNGLRIMNYRAPRNGLGISDWGSRAICLDGTSNFTLNACEIGDFDQPTSGGSGEWFGGGAIMRVNSGINNLVMDCLIHQDNVVQKSGTGTWNIGSIVRTEFRNFPQCVMSAQIILDNHVHDIPNPTDPAAHSNVFYSNDNATYAGNIIHDIGDRAQVLYGSPGLTTAGTFFIANNLTWNTAQFPVAIETGDPFSPSATVRIFNNTFVSGSIPAVRIVPRANSLGRLVVQNNHFVCDNAVFGIGGADGTVINFNHAQNVTNTTTVAAANGFNIANEWAPQSSGTALYNTGTNLAAYLSSDILGVSRPQAVLWDIGAYEFVTSSGVPGTIVMASGTAGVLENAGTVTIPVSRTSGSSGAVGISYTTTAGTATAGVNYTTTSGTLSWANGDSANKNIVVPILNVPFNGSKQFTVTLSSPTGSATLGTPATTTVTITGVGAAGVNLLTPPVFAHPSSVSPPFTSNATYYAQSIQTTDPTQAGIADYYFIVSTSGTYDVFATLLSPSDSQNSLFWAANGNPISPNNVWDTPINSVATEYAIAQRGPTGTFDNPATNAVQVFLTAGQTNRFQIRGREPDVQIHSMRIALASPPSGLPPVILSTEFSTANGYYKTNAVITMTTTWNTNVFTTGSPRIPNNAGGDFVLSGGSGTKVLTFTYTVGAGENSQALDYPSTGSLNLNGGTIRDVNGANAVLTLPAPGGPGSLSYGRSVIVDTIPPTTTLSFPSSPLVAPGGSVFYSITWTDLNFNANSLVDANVHLTGSTTGTVTTGPNNLGPSTGIEFKFLTVGNGAFSVDAGVATDLAGNASAAVGPSPGFTVSSVLGGTANVENTSAELIISNQ